MAITDPVIRADLVINCRLVIRTDLTGAIRLAGAIRLVRAIGLAGNVHRMLKKRFQVCIIGDVIKVYSRYSPY